MLRTLHNHVLKDNVINKLSLSVTDQFKLKQQKASSKCSVFDLVDKCGNFASVLTLNVCLLQFSDKPYQENATKEHFLFI